MGALIFILLLAIIIATVMWGSAARASNERNEEQRRRRQEERRRIDACGQVILFFANYLGYIARSIISRNELEQMIDHGITAPELASHISQKIDEAEGVVLGFHSFGKGQFDVKLPKAVRERHIYIIGKSGYGKTNLLRTMIFQDLEEGRGIGVIAPEQEMLTEEILPYISDHRIDDVIYFNPGDSESPVSFNPLYLDEGEDLDLKVDENFTIFNRLLSEAGPRTNEILRQALYALTGRAGATLLDIERLLDRSDPGFRNEIIRESRDEQVIHFWRDVYPLLPKDAHLPLTTRLGRFIRPKVIRGILCNPHQSLNFRKAMDEGRIMLFNLSDGILGEQNSRMLGQLVVSKFQMAVMARAAQAKQKRKNFYLYIDEFQTFTGTESSSYEKILSRARKYKLSLTLAHQQTGQLPAHLFKEIMGNVSTTICFQVSREDALKFSKELVTVYDGEVINIPEEEILKLKVGQAWCKIGQNSFLMQTYLEDQHPDLRRAAYVIERSQRNYGTPTEGRSYYQASGIERTDHAEPQQQSEAPQQPAQKTHSPVDDLLKDIDPANVFGE